MAQTGPTSLWRASVFVKTSVIALTSFAGQDGGQEATQDGPVFALPSFAAAGTSWTLLLLLIEGVSL